ncbi:hypothetical protein IMG5_181040 [Ichthyophthirius multifiliis]|uniref:Uncharacterized protein n=1 Tax=Ichthyophthirius multifiliis TaxID=5932 RepID=G0R2W4_ICHMU|nr:hypothetical protein IMG5_181040 [Ichthyophthirius multifiliis]EGR28175.1 hypothetical protein IMG5_181040 [Ichthyophthirius multifiliis]|eukprot:XP_004027520.1 hypothetical protein IMG5_181040 [Ichthyophthirius multifiliis]
MNQITKKVKVNILPKALKTLVKAKKRGKKQVLLKPCFKSTIEIFENYVKNGYIGEYEIVDDHRSKKVVVELLGRINKCGVISPRYDVPLNDFEKWTNNVLPSRQFGHVVFTTTYGILTHEECRLRHTGGKALGFFY